MKHDDVDVVNNGSVEAKAAPANPGYRFGDALLRPAASTLATYAAPEAPREDRSYQFGDFFLKPAGRLIAGSVASVLNLAADAGQNALTEAAAHAPELGAQIACQVLAGQRERAVDAIPDLSQPVDAALAGARNSAQRLREQPVAEQQTPYQPGDITRGLLRVIITVASDSARQGVAAAVQEVPSAENRGANPR